MVTVRRSSTVCPAVYDGRLVAKVTTRSSGRHSGGGPVGLGEALRAAVGAAADARVGIEDTTGCPVDGGATGSASATVMAVGAETMPPSFTATRS